jgi:NADPH:quinone reductase
MPAKPLRKIALPCFSKTRRSGIAECKLSLSMASRSLTAQVARSATESYHACVSRSFNAPEKEIHSMLAWLLPEIGSIDSLRLDSIETRPPSEGEVTLDVLYAALNPADRYLAEGLYPARPSFPHVLGRDAIGVVSHVGKEAGDWKPGDKALLLRGEAGVSQLGTLAQQVTVPAECLERIPAGWTDQQAACAALVYVTAYQALTQFDSPSNSVVLISGASGGVGVAATQLANAMGHTVIGLTRNAEKATNLLRLGATWTLNPEDPLWPKSLKQFLPSRRVDLIVDNIGGSLLPKMIDTLGMNGCVSLVGMLAGPIPQFNTASLFFRRLRMRGVAVSTYCLEENREAWRLVVSMLGQINQRPVIDSVFPMNQAPAAFARLAEGPMGKVLVDVANARLRSK